MSADAWTVESDETRPGGVDLELRRGAMYAVVNAYRSRGRGKHVVVSFTAVEDKVSHARAEAHRLAAVLWDTIGDLEQTGTDLEVHRLEVMPGHVVDATGAKSVQVSIDGPDALAALAGFFGDEFADVVR